MFEAQNCPACGSDEVRAMPDLRNDSLTEIEISITCDNCGNDGTATMIPNSFYWDRDEPEEDEEEYEDE